MITAIALLNFVHAPSIERSRSGASRRRFQAKSKPRSSPFASSRMRLYPIVSAGALISSSPRSSPGASIATTCMRTTPPALRPPLPRRARNREGSSTGEISQSGNVSGGLAQQNHTGGITQWTSSTTKARKSSRLTTAVSNEKSITISKRSVYDKFTHGVEFRKLAVVGRSSCDLAAVSACCSECCL